MPIHSIVQIDAKGIVAFWHFGNMAIWQYGILELITMRCLIY